MTTPHDRSKRPALSAILRRTALPQVVRLTVLLLALLLMSGCQTDAPTPEAGSEASSPNAPTTANRENVELEDDAPSDASRRDSLRLDSLWRARVTDVPDSVKYGTYTGGRGYGEFSPETLHLREDGTFQIVFEERADTVVTKATWTSTWRLEGNVFVVSREPDYYVGEGGMMENAGQVPLDYWPYDSLPPDSLAALDSLTEIDQVPNDVSQELDQGIFLADVARHMKRTIERMDTCYVRVDQHRFKPEKEAVFLYPKSGSTNLTKPTTLDRGSFKYSSGTLTYHFNKSLIMNQKPY